MMALEEIKREHEVYNLVKPVAVKFHGERIGMEWVLDKSVFDFSFFGKSVLCISLFNCVGFSNVVFFNVDKSGVGGCGCSNIT